MTSHRGSLRGNTLHSTAIAEEHISVVVDQIKAILVELCRSMCLCNGKTDSVGESLTERASGDFNAGCVVGFWVARCDGVDLAEVLEVIDGDGVAEEVKESVLEHAAVAVSWAIMSASVADIGHWA